MAYWVTIVAAYVLLENVGYAAIHVWYFRGRLPWLSRAVCLWSFLMSVLFLLEVFEPQGWKTFMRDWLYFPMAVEMVWNILLLQVLFPVSLLAAIITRLTRRTSPPPKTFPEAGMSRRKFLYVVACGAAPVTAVAMGVHGVRTRHDLQVREFDVPILNLPPELEGFTIAHVSDLHSGIFVGPERLKIVTDATNALNADLVVVTGDVINREMHEFPAALAAIQQMKSRYGTYLCEGNHDVIPGPGVVVRACAQNRLPMIYNAWMGVPVRGCRLVLGGLSWDSVYIYKAYPQLVADLFPARQPGDVRILLAHHPHLFDVAESADLVLSGHTHGGQIMFGDVGLGQLRFKYCSGRFHRDNTTLIVSNGCGDWFPCRIGAPAEVGLLRLTAAKA
jgi:predicted MPP superfamily phosphohydrolase